MPKLTLLTDDGVRELNFRSGPSLQSLLNTSDLRLRSACRGNGACGLCRVRVEAGELEPPNTAETLHLEAAQLAAGERLACQIHPQGDIAVRLLALAPPSIWRTLPDADYRSIFPPDLRPPGKRHLAIAIDLGTTHICLAVCDLRNGRRLAMRYGPNPQGEFGSDILNRLTAAADDPATALRLQRVVVDAIGQGLLDISSRDGLSLHDVAQVGIVGNTAMLALFAGNDPQPLLDPARWAAPYACCPADTDAWCDRWNLLPGTPVELNQPLAGFIGSDLAVGLVHGRAAQRGGPALFIDFGTNSEMALWDGVRFHVTSAAGGPAFEGMGVRCGMAAEPGAIYRVRVDSDGAWSYEVVGGVSPAGLCGPALVDLLALLVADGTLNEMGQFRETGNGGFSLPLTPFRLDKRDVDVLQQAKSAIATGIESLLIQAGVKAADLATVLIGGAFGRYLDPAGAISIGLLPALPCDRIHLLGNTALNGCQDWLVSSPARQALAEVREHCAVANLSQQEGFGDLFFAHLYLQPFPSKAPDEIDTGADSGAPRSLAFFITAFVHATQYIAGLLLDADMNQEAVAIATRIFKADYARMYAVHGGEVHLARRSHPDIPDALAVELMAPLRQVMESGFISVDEYPFENGGVCFISLPITRDGKVAAILTLGLAGLENPAHEFLDALLGVAGLIGTMLTHQRANALLTQYAENLEAQVNQRTGELEASRAKLEQAYEKLKATQSQLLQQEKMASIGQLAAGVAHEINNPMSFIKSNLGTLQNYAEAFQEYVLGVDAALGEGSGELRVRVDGLRDRLDLPYILNDLGPMIKESLDGAERVRAIVQNLKSFSHVDETGPQQVDLNGFLDSAVNIAVNALNDRIAVVREYDAALPPLECWPQLMNQVFLNLLLNAVQAIETTGEIRLGTQRDGDGVFITIADNGRGIPPAIIGRIFEPFFTTMPVGKGTGLGLSICYDIVKKHGGTISVDSIPEQGTTFTLRLPLEINSSKTNTAG